MKRAFSTDREVRALKPSDRWVDYSDAKARGLIVRVGPLDAKGRFRRTFCVTARFPGSSNTSRAAIGEYGTEMSLEQAREKAAEWRAQIRAGLDPRQAEKIATESAAKREAMLFGTVVETFIERHVRGQRRGAKVERAIRKELLPLWGDRQIGEISRSDVSEVIEAIVARPAPAYARNIYTSIRTFFGWCLDRGMIEASPCDRLKAVRLMGAPNVRQRVLNDNEIRAFWRACEGLDYPYCQLFQMLLLTGQRRNEVGGARWREFDLANKLWIVPPERFKSNAQHRVPLADDAMAVLDSLPRHEGLGAGDHLFSSNRGQSPVDGYAKAKRRLDAATLSALRETDPKAELAPFVLHDLRRTVRTRLSALRVPTEIAEQVIGHARKGLQRVYDQHQFEPEMREALEAWAARLRSIVDPPPSNVVPIERVRS